MQIFKDIKNKDCQISIGQNTVIGENVILGARCKSISIGVGCFIGRDIYIDVDVLDIGDYTTIHHGSIIHGEKTHIGHNCWIGHYTIIDSLGGNTRLGNNVGVGAHSQLWSHMSFGDVLAGCRWNSSGELKLDDDVWLVGHSIVGPIHAQAKSMLMTGSVAVKDMLENHIYAGTPAKDVSERFGVQFDSVERTKREQMFSELKRQFEAETNIDTNQFVSVEVFSGSTDVTEFNLMERSYKPRRTEDEFAFMKFMLYDKAKFVPI